ncbi:hypothetical protein [Flavobacterium franklandianum]|uniref:Uncharacterized protein n=1 Tax=Flavobacterium franklandianum TaxID=2594430 RepID=A0A553CT19_9FLAO|nr:hypothetical protein [Flavobacterium franklandianum]TRX23663.1 hypothetical protein FNW17_00335 [Flavobacterium franklandianum]
MELRCLLFHIINGLKSVATIWIVPTELLRTSKSQRLGTFVGWIKIRCYNIDRSYGTFTYFKEPAARNIL